MFLKKFSKCSKWSLGDLYGTLNIVARVFWDIIFSASDSISLQLVEKWGLVLKLRELQMYTDTSPLLQSLVFDEYL